MLLNTLKYDFSLCDFYQNSMAAFKVFDALQLTVFFMHRICFGVFNYPLLTDRIHLLFMVIFPAVLFRKLK